MAISIELISFILADFSGWNEVTMRFNIQINKGLDEDKIRISYPESDIIII